MEDLNLGVCVPSDRVIHEPYDATMMTSSPNSSPLYAQQQIYIQSSTTTACSSFASSPPSNVVQRCPLLISPLPNRSSESGDLGRANISSRQLHRPRATIPLRLQPEVSSPFIHLVNILIELSQKDGTTSKIKRSLVGGKLASQKFPYDEHGFRDFKDYTVKAQEEGVVVLGGDSGTAWIALPGADDVNQVEA